MFTIIESEQILTKDALQIKDGADNWSTLENSIQRI